MYIYAPTVFEFHSCILPSVSLQLSVYIYVCHVTITLDHCRRHSRLPGVDQAARAAHWLDTRGPCTYSRASHHCCMCRCRHTHVASRCTMIAYNGCTDTDVKARAIMYLHSEEPEKTLGEAAKARVNTGQLRARAAASLDETQRVPPATPPPPPVRAIDTYIMPSVQLHVISYPSIIHYIVCIRYECVHPIIPVVV